MKMNWKTGIRIALVCLLAAGCAACGTKTPSASGIAQAGGWSAQTGDVSMAAQPEAQAAFEKAKESFSGESLEPVAVLGSQVVAGANYCVLCRATPDGGSEPTAWKLVYLYADLQGGVTVLSEKELMSKGGEAGGYRVNAEEIAPDKNERAQTAIDKANLAKEGYEPVVYLGSQVVAGSNHKLLCRKDGTAWEVVTVYQDLQGGASVSQTEPLVLQAAE